MSIDWKQLSQQAANNRQQRDAQRGGTVQTPVTTAQSAIDITRSTSSFWKANPTGLNNLLTQDMKMVLADNRYVFMVTRVRQIHQTKFGPAWFADIELHGEAYTIAFSPNDVRDGIMFNMMKHINENGPVEAILESFINSSNQEGWNLAPPPAPESQQEQPTDDPTDNDIDRMPTRLTPFPQNDTDDVPF